MFVTIIAPDSRQKSFSDDYCARLDPSTGTVMLQVRSVWKRHFKTSARCTVAALDAHLANRGSARDVATHDDLSSIAMSVRMSSHA